MSQDTSMIDPEILQSDQQVSVTREEPTIQRVTPIQQETTSPPLATTLHDYASIDAFERLQSVRK